LFDFNGEPFSAIRNSILIMYKGLEYREGKDEKNEFGRVKRFETKSIQALEASKVTRYLLYNGSVSFL